MAEQSPISSGELAREINVSASAGANPSHPSAPTIDSRLAYSPDALRVSYTAAGPSLVNRGITWQRASLPRSAPVPEQWSGLIGEYGWPYDKLYILENQRHLTALIEWYEFAPLQQLSPDHFLMPSYGLYDKYAWRAIKSALVTPRKNASGSYGPGWLEVPGG